MLYLSCKVVVLHFLEFVQILSLQCLVLTTLVLIFHVSSAGKGWNVKLHSIKFICYTGYSAFLYYDHLYLMHKCHSHSLQKQFCFIEPFHFTLYLIDILFIGQFVRGQTPLVNAILKILFPICKKKLCINLHGVCIKKAVSDKAPEL